MIWTTSDQHFNHKNILKYEPTSRPFETVEEMNKVLIERWNSVVKPKDMVIHCGDLFMGIPDEIDRILPQLNGNITLVEGNHDTKPRIEKYIQHGVKVVKSFVYEFHNKAFIFLHDPASIVFEDMYDEDLIFCYGHVHHNAPQGFVHNTIHVGVDTNNLTPVSLKDIWEQYK